MRLDPTTRQSLDWRDIGVAILVRVIRRLGAYRNWMQMAITGNTSNKRRGNFSLDDISKG